MKFERFQKFMIILFLEYIDKNGRAHSIAVVVQKPCGYYMSFEPDIVVKNTLSIHGDIIYHHGFLDRLSMDDAIIFF